MAEAADSSDAPRGDLAPVLVVWSQGPRQWLQHAVPWHPGLAVGQAIAACPWPSEQAQALRDDLSHGRLRAAVWNRLARPDQVLNPGDRVELLRGLRVDPKVARRERFSAQGTRAAGLFGRTQRPPGAR